MGVEVHESTAAPAQAPAGPVEPAEGGGTSARVPTVLAGLVDFALAGTELAGEFRCGDCGYGAVIHHTLPVCPMCGGSVWEKRGPP